VVGELFAIFRLLKVDVTIAVLIGAFSVDFPDVVVDTILLLEVEGKRKS